MIKTNEVLLKVNNEWLHFTEPKQIIVAKTLKDVLPASREMERLVNVNEWYAAGFLSYEAASAFDMALHTKAVMQTEDRRTKETEFPFLWFGLYPSPRVISLPEPEPPREILNWQPAIDRDTYQSSIDQIREHIAEGRTYQVNFTMRLQTDYPGSEWDFFLHLAQGQNNHAAYIDLGRYVICSASPELFFQLDGNTITCRPMKGTVKRGRTTAEDIKQAQWLKDSEKNRAENVMIVDMVRNDLGRIARIGSVNVPELFNTERYPTLWQMTSTVTAKTSASLTDIFSALFPSASITGAPKVGTMKIISELESTSRSIYTGSLGYISPGRKSEFNVAIRTALMDRQTQKAEYGVGGGIVWDSTSTDEYAEALLKARVLTQQPAGFSLLETILWTPDKGFFLREKHIERMLDSADYFDYPISKAKIEEYLDQISSKFNSPQRVRLLLDRSGTLSSQIMTTPRMAERAFKAILAKQPIDSDNVFLFHKTTKRDFYESARKAAPGFDDVLLYNELDELTEFTIGNLVVELEGKYFTPPLSCGLLAGTFRAHLLETGQVAERTLQVNELKHYTQIFMVNSVRKWQRVEIKQ
ncbi:MAG TPA: aminodeoxychorismate synthase component I [Anaerolineales bacterium]|nr:aminodeoxychorismate synthase component I [Anaerolineales bacterium]